MLHAILRVALLAISNAHYVVFAIGIEPLSLHTESNRFTARPIRD